MIESGIGVIPGSMFMTKMKEERHIYHKGSSWRENHVTRKYELGAICYGCCYKR